MRAIVNTLRYQARAYLHTTKPVMPFCALVLLVGLLYAVSPVLAADSYAASATILCFIAAWIGFAHADVEDTVSEQLLTLKLDSLARYQLACTLFLALVGLAASVLAMALPMLMSVVHGFALYKTPPTASTMMGGLVLHACVAFMGTATGAFFHPRLFPERSIALLVICFVLVTGFVKIGIHRLLPAAVAVTWLFPPISEISEALAGMDSFPPGALLGLILRCLLYGGVLSATRIAVIARRRFA